MRWLSEGHLYDSAGPGVFANAEKRQFILACLNSKPALQLLKMISPTISLQIAEIERTPVPTAMFDDAQQRKAIAGLVDNCVGLARADWDNFETSWDFRDLPLLRLELKGATLEASWRNWEAHCIVAIHQMQELETENNRLFIDAYGLDGELQPEVPEEQITLARADARRDIAAFLSYAIGCMMGRYRLDQPGLIYAHSGNQGFDPSQYPTFPADADGIIPLLATDWGFPDDATQRTHEFLRATFGEATLNDNLRFIEEALGKDLRKYFLTDFYKDGCV